MTMFKSSVNPRGRNVSIPVANIRMSPNVTLHSSSEIKVSIFLCMHQLHLTSKYVLS